MGQSGHLWVVCLIVLIIGFLLLYLFFRSDNNVFNPNIENRLNKGTKQTSRGEKECRRILEEKFGKKFPNIRPDFLKNPKTKRNLELDCYNQELKLALEYQGIQHYVYPNYYHKTREEFNEQQSRDEFKVKRCKEEGIFLIVVPYNIKNKYIDKYITEELKRHNEGYNI